MSTCAHNLHVVNRNVCVPQMLQLAEISFIKSNKKDGI